ncbi:MAG: membrane protein insertase YidC [Actinomycetes bacterium]
MIDTLLAPLEWVISALLYFFHQGFSSFLDPTAGLTWALSIVGLVIVVRILIIPLFVRQVKSQRNLQLIQPQMKELQKKYAGDREKLGQEMMKLYRETGTNPLASCFPILLQAPIFFALFRVLQYGISQEKAIGYFVDYPNLVSMAHDAELIGVPLWGYFRGAAQTPNPLNTQILTVALVILMSLTTFLTQRQLMVKNMPANTPMIQQQKILLYVFPVIFAVGGVGFPIGVLIYWSTTNIWSMGQQFWIIRNNPTPGTPAYDAWEKRKRAKKHQDNVVEGEVKPEEINQPKRQQPKRISRKDRKNK